MSFKDDKEKNQKEQPEEKLNKESRKDKTHQPITNTGVGPDEHPKPNPGIDADAASG